MKGFELEINGEIISGGTEGGTVIVASIVGDKMELNFGGMSFNEDKSIKENITWYESKLEEGDEFIVRVKKLKK